ncbi:MAG: hypothetical protein JWN43_758, partial [Gammaproteobacteria bacterium]|nr:hypothetical protein [Gammaproteobacteria bacterium]
VMMVSNAVAAVDNRFGGPLESVRSALEVANGP